MIDLSSEINQILIAYTGAVDDELEKASKEVANEAVQKLKATSPKNRPEYYKGWRVKKITRGNVVYNATYPSLTHILEKGYSARGRRVAGQPHIGPVEEWVDQEFTKRLTSGIEQIRV